MQSSILLVEDHKILRDGIRAVIEKCPLFRVAGEAAVGQLDQQRPVGVRRPSEQPSLASMLHSSISPTIVNGGYRVNVIPSEAKATLDGAKMVEVMDKLMAMGMSVDDVIVRSTWHPAREIKRDDLGHLSVGAAADVAVLRLEQGNFGFVDMYGARMRGTQKLTCELTLRDGKVVYDLNGMTRPDWNTLPKDYRQTGDARWDAVTPAPVRR